MEETTESLIQMNVGEAVASWSLLKGYLWHRDTCTLVKGQLEARCDCGLQNLYYQLEGSVQRLIQLSDELEGS